jgi:hypothetical protein
MYKLAAMGTGAGLNAEEIFDSIFLVRDVLKAEEITSLLDFVKTSSEDGWNAGNLRRQESIARNLYGPDTSDEVVQIFQDEQSYVYWSDKVVNTSGEKFDIYTAEITKRISPFFDGLYKVSEFAIINRQYPGVGLDEHKDQGDDLTLVRAVLLYLNDDYEGGELYFPQLDFSIKPPAGSLLTFPAIERWTHGVTPVRGDRYRYVMPGLAWEL